jgi:hypothetical protein
MAAPAHATIEVDSVLVELGRPSFPRTLNLGSNDIHIVVTAEGGAMRDYHLVVQRGFAVDSYLKASNNAAQSNFGQSVAISGDTLVVGAPDESSDVSGVNMPPAGSAVNSGAAYVFVRSGGVWSQQAYLKASNDAASNSATPPGKRLLHLQRLMLCLRTVEIGEIDREIVGPGQDIHTGGRIVWAGRADSTKIELISTLCGVRRSVLSGDPHVVHVDAMESDRIARHLIELNAATAHFERVRAARVHESRE